jgi:hypothetical protein
MGKCEKCGNFYDKAFTVEMNGSKHTFDSFECAISILAPKCEHCNVSIIGHGVEIESKYYCCAHCAEQNGQEGVVDRIYNEQSRH